jgi:hypothetical protein
MSRREKRQAAPGDSARVVGPPPGLAPPGPGGSGRVVSPAPGLSSLKAQRWLSIAALVLAVLIFYWIPLTDAGTTPQWDAIDYHLSVQKYFGDEIRNGRVPSWTEYTFSGYPFLADPQVGAWYPLNWPFFVYGVTPGALQWELALHSLLACLGVFLLALEWIESPPLAAMAAMMYGFSGFFAGHSSHIGMFQCAAWLPWLLLGAHRALASGRNFALIGAGLAGACLFLAGHFQTALYSFGALLLYMVGMASIGKCSWWRAGRTLGGIGLVTVLLSAVQILPAYELASQSIRAAQNYTQKTSGTLEWRALGTLFYPNIYGSVSGKYSGPLDRTQYYLYGGILLIPLAAVGILAKRLRWVGLALAVPAAWYAFGPPGGLYRLIAVLPGFAKVRAPVHAWFVVALGLALLAGAGAEGLSRRWRTRWLVLALAGVTFCDLTFWNSLRNQLAYARSSFEELYGRREARAAAAIRQALPDGTRFHAPSNSPTFGPMNDSLDERLEVTYGYNPLELTRYSEYISAIAANPRLLAALNASRQLRQGRLEAVKGTLPRFFFARGVAGVSGPAESLARLASTDPAAVTLVEGAAAAPVSPSGAVTIERAEQGLYVLKFQTPGPGLLRTAIPWFPGWQARSDGKQLAIRIVDHALLGVEVPAGSGEVVLEYHCTWFPLGAGISLLALAAVVFGLAKTYNSGFAAKAEAPQTSDGKA